MGPARRAGGVRNCDPLVKQSTVEGDEEQRRSKDGSNQTLRLSFVLKGTTLLYTRHLGRDASPSNSIRKDTFRKTRLQLEQRFAIPR